VPTNILRLVYVVEFLIAVMAVLTLWSQIGGQGHLDLMPWYLKLGLTMAMALITVMGTMAAISHPDPWNAKAIAFVILGLLIACGMAAASYYYHIHENDEDEGDDTTNTAMLDRTNWTPYADGGPLWPRGRMSRGEWPGGYRP
jgi:hypothetical protein